MLLIIFVIIGIYSPTLKYVEPMFIENLTEKYGAQINFLTDFNIADVFIEFFQAVNEIGILLVMCFIITSILSDKTHGNISVFITRGLKRSDYLLQLLMCKVVIFGVGYVLAFIFNSFYCKILWGQWYIKGIIPCLALAVCYLFFYSCVSLLIGIYF